MMLKPLKCTSRHFFIQLGMRNKAELLKSTIHYTGWIKNNNNKNKKKYYGKGATGVYLIFLLDFFFTSCGHGDQVRYGEYEEQ